MNEIEGQAELLSRLRTAENHLHAVIGMVETDIS